jgi:hypothetical protein
MIGKYLEILRTIGNNWKSWRMIHLEPWKIIGYLDSGMQHLISGSQPARVLSNAGSALRFRTPLLFVRFSKPSPANLS